MKFLLLSLSSLILAACSGGGGGSGGGAGATTYKYQASGTAPFLIRTVSSRATPFVIKWNESGSTISGIYEEGGDTKTVTGTVAGGGARTMSITLNPPENGVSTISLDLPAGNLSGSVAGTIKTYDSNAVVLSTNAITVDTTTTNTGGGNTTVTMPAITCTGGTSYSTPAQGNRIELTTQNNGVINMCVGASNTFTILGESFTDGSYTYAGTTNYMVGNITAQWNGGDDKVLAAFCFQFSDRGTVSANFLSDGSVDSDSGTFRIYNTGCP